MKRIPLLTLALISSLMAQPYFIKGPESPKPYETMAIKELTEYLAKRIDGNLTIGEASPVTFHVGDTEFAARHKLLSDSLPDDEWHIKSIGNNVILNGGGTHGALYATYHFLEDYCGIHWWSVVEEYVPAASSLTLDALDVSGKPAFIYRDMYVAQSGPNHSQLRARVRLNGSDGVKTKAEFGGSFRYGPPSASHTFERYFPAKKYLESHPEYFSLLDGKRKEGQLCVMNKELRKEFLKKLLENIENSHKAAEAAGISAPQIYDVSMNDNHSRCQCDECKAAEEKYNPSGLYLDFVNELAAEVKKKYPNVFISTLAYYYNELPPKGGIKAADNVIVRLCDTQTNQAASILEPCNKVYLDMLSQWKSHAKNLFIWDYSIVYGKNMTGLPFASEWHYGDLFRTYHENNVSGIFWEHEEPHMADMYELKFFLETKLMENPYLDDRQLIETFMTCYYGQAAQYVKQYRLRLDQLRKERNGRVEWFPILSAFNYIDDNAIVEFNTLFEKAEAAVKDDKTVLARVRHARCGLDRLICMRKGCGWSYHGPALSLDNRIDVAAAYRRLMESWPVWARQFPGDETLAKQVIDMISLFDNAQHKLSPPDEFKNRNFYDFFPNGFVNYRNAGKLIDDSDSPVGKALRVQADASDYYKLPFALGYYDQGNKKTLSNVSYQRPHKKGYAWYSGGKVRIPSDGSIFVTRSWYVSQRTGTISSNLIGKEYEIFVSAKFTGPLYWSDEQGESYIYIDRMLLVEPE